METLQSWLGPWGLLAFAVVLAAILVAALVAWGRQKWADALDARDRRRRERAEHHYAMGLASIVAGNPDLAIRELHTMLESEAQTPQAYALLGDLYREKGRVELAIRLHEMLLRRQDLSDEDRVLALSSLGKDFARAGLIERARKTFEEAQSIDRGSLTPLVYLQRLAEETRSWARAIVLQEQLLSLRPDDEAKRHLGFLHWRLGEEQRESGEPKKALRSYQKAVQTWAKVVPAYLAMGDLYLESGEKARAAQAWMQLVEADARRSYLVLERLDALWAEQGEEERAAELAERILETDPKEWRAAIFLARRALTRGRTEEAVPWLRKAVERNPRSVEAHGLAWHLSLPGDPPELLKQLRARFQEAGAFEEPYVCTSCRYRTTDRLWRCPHCHRWDTFAGQHG